MRVALLQLNPTVGAVRANAEAVAAAYRDAVADGAELVVTGEMVLSGYPPEDLLLRRDVIDALDRALDELAATVGAVPLVVGTVRRAEADRPAGGSGDPGPGGATSRWPADGEAPLAPRLVNVAAVVHDGRVAHTYRKQHLPDYGVFDESRWFDPGGETVVVEVAGCRVGLTVCEDLWGEDGPAARAAETGAQVLVNLSASPFHRGKAWEREAWAAHHARSTGCWVVWANLVGGQDELVFDGASFVTGPDGRVRARARHFAEDVVLAEVGPGQPTELADGVRADGPSPPGELEAIWSALVTGTGDYLAKNGATTAWVGVSGGLDSALTLAVAVDALGPANVTGVSMPSPHTADSSRHDAEAVCANLGCGFLELAIEPAMKAAEEVLGEVLAGTEPDTTEENLQSRIRGMLLMALSNKHGGLVLATGNKSEMAVGYATLYGDMCGGLAVLKDVPKTLAYRLAEHRNARQPVIPETTIARAPSAELRPGQLDTDALPPYDELDPILESYVEREQPVGAIVAAGHDEQTVRKVVDMVDAAEHKRRQAPPGIKITARAFGRDRRMPITSRWRA